VILVDICSVLSGLGPICKFFLEAKDPPIKFTNGRGLR
jgi:hypothetical protein